MGIYIPPRWLNEFRIPGIITESDLEDSQAPNLLDKQIEATRRALEQEIDRKIVHLLELQRVADERAEQFRLQVLDEIRKMNLEANERFWNDTRFQTIRIAFSY